MPIFMQFYQRVKELRFQLSRSDFVRTVGAIALLAIVGSVAYGALEGWSVLDSVYATIITITTVGYGDVAPRTPQGRLFAIFFTLFAIIIGGYAISTLAAYTIENRQRNLAIRFRKRLMERIRTFNGHYILCGADLLGTRIAEEFYLQGVNYVVIDDDEALLKFTLLYSHPEYFQQKLKTLVDFHEVDLSEFESMTLPELSERLKVPYFLADPTDDSVLIEAGIERAAGLIAARPDDRDNLSIVIGARSLARRFNNDALKIMTRSSDPRNMRKLYLAGADSVRIPSIMSGMEMALHILNPEIGNWWYSRVGEETTKHAMFKQINLVDKTQWVGQTVSQIHQTTNKMIVSVKRLEQFISPPPYDFVLQTNDIVIVVE